MQGPIGLEHDDVVHAGVSTGVAGPPIGPTGKAPVRGLGKSVAPVYTSTVCDGSKGAIHAPGPAHFVTGVKGVNVYGVPILRTQDPNIQTSCAATLRSPSRSVIIGGEAESPASTMAGARGLMKIGGHGTLSDADIVAKELSKMPHAYLGEMKKNGTKVVACRGSVTDYATDLKGVHPRGWADGDTWDTVPGANMGGRNEVVIATRGHDTPAGAHVPATGDGHGSANLVTHESLHSIDNGRSGSGDFNGARDKDVNNLPAYERQDGSAGKEESYAESGARHFENKDRSTPALRDYWTRHEKAP